MSNVAIMQPYFMPYIGYFQLINSVDKFVIYDNIQYTKKGFINRNRILFNGKDRGFTIPIKKSSDYLDVVEREISNTWLKDGDKLINLIKQSYRNAPYFNVCLPLITECIKHDDPNLFNFIHNSVKILCNYLDINTQIIKSSDVPIDHSKKSQDKVIAICKSLKATKYINAIGGQELYKKPAFKKEGIDLSFIKTNYIEYKQFNNRFEPWLSIIDLLMFNSQKELKKHTNNYNLI
ncbi:MAG: hypothetical protein CMC98_01870 [Flavobacteriales bacterium]|nr:hypothetical protein [Flavobacteriales bacterium]